MYTYTITFFPSIIFVVTFTRIYTFISCTDVLVEGVNRPRLVELPSLIHVALVFLNGLGAFFVEGVKVPRLVELPLFFVILLPFVVWKEKQRNVLIYILYIIKLCYVYFRLV